ncbi:MAG: ribokinase [Candidatus Eisenbacteria bacterium]|nr:ribokinase [Candidatus Eisenbacteria bacterium]
MPAIDFPPRLPAARTWDVVGLGANAADHLLTVTHHPRPGEKVRFCDYRYQGGGQTATALVTVARLGHRARYIGAVGDDADGRANLTGLRDEGVDVSAVRVRPGGLTQRAMILIDRRTGERTIVWGRSPGLVLGAEEIEAEQIAAGRILHTDAQDPHASARAARIARAAGMPVMVDLERAGDGIDALLPEVDLLIAADGFAEAVSGAERRSHALRWLGQRTRGALVLVTRGAEGCELLRAGAVCRYPAYAVEAADTTGAGDVFHGAFAVGCLHGWPLEEVIDFSQAVAAMKCRQVGGRGGIPRRLEEVDAFRAATPHRR